MARHRRLEIVAQTGRPLRPAIGKGLAQWLAAGPSPLAVIPAVGFNGGNAKARPDDDNVGAGQIGERRDVVAASEPEGRAADEEKWHVCAKTCSETADCRRIDVELPDFREPQASHPRVGAAAAEP